MGYGVFLARMQPLHDAHMFLVEEAMRENDKVLIVLGSANKSETLRNPFDLETRRELLLKALRFKGYLDKDINKISVIELPDWSYENDKNETTEWGRYLYYNVVSRIESKKFRIYYSDEPSTIKKWFEGIPKDRVELMLYDRNNTFEGLSATKVRQALIDEDRDYLSKYVPLSILDEVMELGKTLKDVVENPMEDFKMA